MLALLLCGKGLIDRVADVPGSSVSLGVYRKGKITKGKHNK